MSNIKSNLSNFITKGEVINKHPNNESLENTESLELLKKEVTINVEENIIENIPKVHSSNNKVFTEVELSSIIQEKIGLLQTIHNTHINKKEDVDLLINNKGSISSDILASAHTIISELIEKEYKKLRSIYVVKRNKMMGDGIKLDTSITIAEQNDLKRKALKDIMSTKGNRAIINFLEGATSNSYDFFSDVSLDVKKRYEMNKEYYINVYGFTPESFELFSLECQRIVDEKKTNFAKATVYVDKGFSDYVNMNIDPNTGKFNSSINLTKDMCRQVLTLTREEIQTAARKTFEPIKDFVKGKIYYESEFLKELLKKDQEYDKKLEQDFKAHGDEQISKVIELVAERSLYLNKVNDPRRVIEINESTNKSNSNNTIVNDVQHIRKYDGFKKKLNVPKVEVKENTNKEPNTNQSPIIQEKKSIDLDSFYVEDLSTNKDELPEMIETKTEIIHSPEIKQSVVNLDEIEEFTCSEKDSIVYKTTDEHVDDVKYNNIEYRGDNMENIKNTEKDIPLIGRGVTPNLVATPDDDILDFGMNIDEIEELMRLAKEYKGSNNPEHKTSHLNKLIEFSGERITALKNERREESDKNFNNSLNSNKTQLDKENISTPKPISINQPFTKLLSDKPNENKINSSEIKPSLNKFITNEKPPIEVESNPKMDTVPTEHTSQDKINNISKETNEVVSVMKSDIEYIDVIKTRNKDKASDSKYSDICLVTEGVADLSKLRNINNATDRVQYIRNSKAPSTKIYLPNSNVMVSVKKITDSFKLDYMIRLLNDCKDLVKIDVMTKFELYKIIFDVCEFEFSEEVTFEEFLMSISTHDMPLIMMLLGLTFIKEEDDGTIPLSIDVVKCANPAHALSGIDIHYRLKTPIILDLKSEFRMNYPIDIYIKNSPLYKTKNYSNIVEAYRDPKLSASGKLYKIVKEVNGLEYTMLISDINLYKEFYSIYKLDEVIYNKSLEHLKIVNELIKVEKGLVDSYKDFEKYSYHEFNRFSKEFATNNIVFLEKYQKSLNDGTNMDFIDSLDDNGKHIIDRYLKLEAFIDIVDYFTEVYNNFTSLIFYIDNISIKDIATNTKIVDKISHSNVEDMYNILLDMSNEEEIADGIKKALEAIKNNFISYDTNIKLTGEELGQLFDIKECVSDIDEVIAKQEEMFNVELTEDQIEKLKLELDINSNNLQNHGKCYCGSTTYNINYLNILFFSMYPISEVMQKK